MSADSVLWRTARRVTLAGERPWGLIGQGAILTRRAQIEWTTA